MRSRFLGTYSCEVGDVTVRQDEDGRLWLDQTPKGIFAELGAGAGARSNWSGGTRRA